MIIILVARFGHIRYVPYQILLFLFICICYCYCCSMTVLHITFLRKDVSVLQIPLYVPVFQISQQGSIFLCLLGTISHSEFSSNYMCVLQMLKISIDLDTYTYLHQMRHTFTINNTFINKILISLITIRT